MRADQVGNRVVDGRAEEDDALTQESAVQVVGSLAAVRRFDNRGDEVVLGSEMFVHATTLRVDLFVLFAGVVGFIGHFL